MPWNNLNYTYCTPLSVILLGLSPDGYELFLLQELTKADDFGGRPLSVKYEKKKKKDYPQYESVEESNALKNWQRRMLERRKQQGYLSSEWLIFSVLLMPLLRDH